MRQATAGMWAKLLLHADAGVPPSPAGCALPAVVLQTSAAS